MSRLSRAALLGSLAWALGAFAYPLEAVEEADLLDCPEATESADQPGDEAGSYLLQVRLDHMAKVARSSIKQPTTDGNLVKATGITLDDAASQVAAAAAAAAANIPPEALAPVWPWGKLAASILGKPSAGQNATADLTQVSHCLYIFGMPKLTWAVLCDALGLAVVLLCIPLLLTCSRRRPPGSPLFDCGSTAPPPWQVDSSFKGPGVY